MQYMGGKVRMARHIREAILAHVPETDRALYWEPFCGGAAVLEKISGDFTRALASDIHEDLILMWKAVQDGWLPPETVTEEDWRTLKTSPPSPLRGAVGFGCSFGGRWFEGYARQTNYNFAKGLRKVLHRASSTLGNVDFRQMSYTAYSPSPGTVVYCDPPYANTKEYSGTSSFDSDLFWETASQWRNNGCHVFVSEYEAPPGWSVVWQRAKKVTMQPTGAGLAATERLYVLGD